MKKLFTIIVIIGICATTVLMAQQQPNKLGKMTQSLSTYTQNQMKLTLDKLEKATTIRYHYDNGSLPPEYHYSCNIIVTKGNVNVCIIIGYDGEVKYNQNHAINFAEYQKFLKSLVNQGITKTPDNNSVLAGGDVSVITVKENQQVIFEGEERIDLSIVKGNLDDSFLSLLPEDMKRAASNPEQFLNR